MEMKQDSTDNSSATVNLELAKDALAEAIKALDAHCLAGRAQEILEDAGYSTSKSSDDDRVILAISSSEDDDESGLDDLRAELGDDYDVEHTGSGNTDGDGYTTEDVSVSLRMAAYDRILEELNDAVAAAEEAVSDARESLASSNELREWKLYEDGECYATTMAGSAADALEEARSNVDRANYTPDGALWIDIRVVCEETGEEDSAEVVLDEDEPDCEDGEEHDWQSPHEILGGLKENPGVWGKGGGVIMTSVCMRCGCGRHTDTWAQRPDNGVQGYTVVTYEAGEFEDEVSEILEARAREKGAEDGFEAVETALSEQGREAVVATLKPWNLDWDEGAINAETHRFSGIPDSHSETYYEAYAKAARERAEEIAEEQDDD
jgi:hypothetical protein